MDGLINNAHNSGHGGKFLLRFSAGAGHIIVHIIFLSLRTRWDDSCNVTGERSGTGATANALSESRGETPPKYFRIPGILMNS